MSFFISKIRELFTTSPDAIEKVLPRIVDRKIVTEALLSCPDRRDLVRFVSERLCVDQEDLTRALSFKMGLPYIQRPSSVDLTQIGVSIADLRRLACIPIASNGFVSGLICVDPNRKAPWPTSILQVPRSLSTWQAIARAIDESERRYLNGHLADGSAAPNGAAVEEMLRFIVSQAKQHCASEVKLSVDRYWFITSCGTKGEGKISLVAWRQIEPYLEEHDEILLRSDDGADLRNREVYKVIRDGKRHGFALQFMGAKVILLPISNRQPSVDVSQPRADDVIIVEDNPTFAAVLERFLKRNKISVQIFFSVEDARVRIERCVPRLIVTDLHLPGASGYDFLLELRRSAATMEVPVVVLSSDSSAESRVGLIKAGAAAVIGKGEDPRVLSAHIERLLAIDAEEGSRLCRS